MARHNLIGTIGEDVAVEFLESKGHKILSRNYRKAYGELDIVSRGKDENVHFVEVKTVSYETEANGVPYETGYRPEENVHPAKVKRLMHTIEAYILEKDIGEEWQFDVIAVYLDDQKKEAKVRWLENVVLGS